MDQSQNHHQLHHQLHSQTMSPLQQQQNLQHQLQHDATPQDVLAEARKNLQVLIDSGLSKDLLHQWVDDSQSLQLQLGLSNMSIPPQSSIIPPQPTLAPPPPPQCPPPPPPMQVPSISAPPSAVTTGLLSPSAASSASSSVTSTHSSASTPTATTPTPDIKTESLSEELAAAWSQAPSCVLTSPSDDASMFLPPSAPFSHRPRISVSSTSSGSSGHASIWSTHSAQSTMSWQSASTGRSQAPLPMPPSNASAPGGPLMNGAQVAAAAAASKQNIYWCTSCETSFKRKYDWKRHEDEFHERWRKYPCPEPGCNRSFWGSNSFNQHHKQCHGCKTCPHAEKVVKFLRKRKYWACGFCSALHPARERHVEHVARHFESGMTKGDWMHSRVVYGLLHQPLIHEAWDALVASKQPEYAGRRPQFSWHPSKTGRAQGFLEKESPGQLQDLLEFFSGDEGEAQWIVSVAYDLADIVLTTAPVQSPQFAQPGMGQHAFPGQDPRVSFSPLPTQAQQQQQQQQQAAQQQQQQQQQQQLLGSPFRNTIFVPSQSFPQTQHSSPGSASHSSHSPMAPSHSPLDKRELPPPPPSAMTEPAATMMDFEYLPAPVVFDDWESIASSITGEPTPQQINQPQQNWNMSHYFSDPRIPS